MSIKSTLFLCSMLICMGHAHAQWQWLNPTPSGYSGVKIKFTDKSHGYILNGNGDLLVTANTGASWSIQANFPYTQAMDIKDSTGVLAGYFGTLYVSRDNGATWQKKSTPYTDNFSLVDVVSRDTFFLVNKNNGKIYRTDDAGQTWKSYSCGISLSSAAFVNSKVGYAGGTNTYILKTDDGGATWKESVKVNISPSNTLTLFFLDADNGFAYREHSTMLRTADGGKSWTSTNLLNDVYSMDFIDRNTGYACGWLGFMYKTTNGGATWTAVSPIGGIYFNDLYSICFVDALTCIATGARGRILKTSNGGATWSEYSPTYTAVSDVAVPSVKAAYAPVANTLLKSTDNGQTWKQLAITLGAASTPEKGTFKYTQFFQDDVGFVTAQAPVRIYKTYDGGANWKRINVAQYAYDYANCVFFLNKQVGYMSISHSSSGLIVKTRDGGETWSNAWNPTYFGDFFDKLFFLNEKTGFANRYAKLYNTQDSGRTWQMVLDNDSFNDIHAIWFTSPSTGFIAGDNALLKKTVDSGKTWTKVTVSSNYYDDIYNLKFLDQQIGYFTAENGAIYKTIDGGNTWQLNGNTGASTTTAISYAPDSTVYVAGDYGAILRSSVGWVSIDSFRISMPNNCSTTLQGMVTARGGTADSIQFEYGTTGYTAVVKAVPGSIGGQAAVSAPLTSLQPGTLYTVRMRLMWRGQPYYSNSISFRTPNKPATPSIVAGGDTSFCEGGSVVLASSAGTGNQWFVNGLPGNTSGQTYNATQSGLYQLVTLSGCYSSDTASVRIRVTPLPAKPTIRANGSQLISSAPAGNQWKLDGTDIPGATGSQYTAAANGRYNVQVTQNGCSSPLSDTLNFTLVGATTIAYPNPVRDQLVIRNTGPGTVQFEITDARGLIVHKGTFSSGTYTVNMRKQARGVYFVKVGSAATRQTTVAMILKQ